MARAGHSLVHAVPVPHRYTGFSFGSRVVYYHSVICSCTHGALLSAPIVAASVVTRVSFYSLTSKLISPTKTDIYREVFFDFGVSFELQENL